MPNLTATLPETEQSITRPVVFGIIEQISAITKITKDAEIYFPGDLGKIRQPGSGIDNETKEAKIGSARRIFVEVREIPEADYMSEAGATARDHMPVFYDDKVGVRITPRYVNTRVEISFKYQTPSRSEVLRWRDDIYIRHSSNRDTNSHDIKYSYALPEAFIELLEAIHTNREAVDGYKDTLLEYVVNHSTNRLTLVGDLTNKTSKFVIAEKQVRVLGNFDFQGVSEKEERNQETGTYSISFNYVFNYDKPTTCHVYYPIIVHNNLLPNKFIEFVNTDYNIDNVPKRYSINNRALAMFNAYERLDKILDVDPIIRIPFEDDFILPEPIIGTATFMSVLSTIDDKDKKSLFNIKEMGDYKFDDDILSFILGSEYTYINKLYQSPIEMIAILNGKIDYNLLEMDSDGNIKSKVELSLRDTIRVKFAIVTDYSFLTMSVINRLKKYPKACSKILQSVREAFIDNPGIKRLGDKRLLTDKDLKPILRYLIGIDIRPDPHIEDPNDVFSHLKGRDLALLSKIISRLKTVQLGYLVGKS